MVIRLSSAFVAHKNIIIATDILLVHLYIGDHVAQNQTFVYESTKLVCSFRSSIITIIPSKHSSLQCLLYPKNTKDALYSVARQVYSILESQR